MARLIYGLNVSLDGYVDHDRFAPDPELFRYFIGLMKSVTGSLYGRRMYEIMRYWDEDQDGWGEAEAEYAQAWRETPKWVVSSTLKTVGPNATLITGDLGAAVRELKANQKGVIETSGPVLAGALTGLGLIDEYQLYLHPVVLGSGSPFFSGARPPLHLVASDRIGPEVIRLTYTPT